MSNGVLAALLPDVLDKREQAKRNKRARVDPNKPLMAQPSSDPRVVKKPRIVKPTFVEIEGPDGIKLEVELPEGVKAIPGEFFSDAIVPAMENLRQERRAKNRQRFENVQRRGYGDAADLADEDGGAALYATLTDDQKRALVKDLAPKEIRGVVSLMMREPNKAWAEGMKNAAEGPRQVVDTVLSLPETIGGELGVTINGKREKKVPRDPATGNLLVSKDYANERRAVDPEFRVGSTVGEYGSYLIPGVNMVLGANQGAQTVDIIATKGVAGGLKEIIGSMNPAQPGIHPEDRVLRAAGLLIGGWHLKGRAVNLAEGRTLAKQMKIPLSDAMSLARTIGQAERSQKGVSNAYLRWAKETGYDRGVRETGIQEGAAIASVAPEPTVLPTQPGVGPGLLTRRPPQPPPPSIEQLATEANARRETRTGEEIDAAYQNSTKPATLQSRDEYIADRWRRQTEIDIQDAQFALKNPEQTFAGMGERARRKEVAKLRSAIRAARVALKEGKPDADSRIIYAKEWEAQNYKPLAQDAGPEVLPEGVTKVEPKSGNGGRNNRTAGPGLFDAGESVQPVGTLANGPGKEGTGETSGTKPKTTLPEGVTDTRASSAFTPDGQSANVRFEVVERDSIRSSHNPKGEQNPTFPANLQPRDRSQPTYLQNIDSRAKALNPSLLLEDFKATDRGAPVVNADGTVLSGNGRVMILDTARSKYPLQYAAYRKALGEKFPESANMRDPVLVQRFQADETMTDENIARRSNQSSSDEMSTVERAFESADDLPKDIESRFEFTGKNIETAVNSAKNRELIGEYMAKLPEEKRTSLIDASGNLSVEGRSMVAKAIMARALGRDAAPILRRMYEAGEARKSVAAGLEASSPSLLKLRAAEMGGNKVAGEVRETIIKALGYVDEAQRSGAPRKWFDQSSIEDRSPGAMKLARALVENPRASATSEIFQRAAAAGEDSSGGLFGDETAFKTGDEAISAAFEGMMAPEDGSIQFSRAEGKQGGESAQFSESSKGGEDGAQEGRTGFGPKAIRIKPEPGGSADAPNPMRILEKLLGKPVLEGKQAQIIKRAAGYFRPSTKATTARSINSLEVAMHEVAHAIDDRYKIVDAILADQNLRSEMKWFESQGGSGGVGKSDRYNAGEGFAEFIRSYMSDPDAARAKAPKMAAWIESNLPSEVVGQLNDAGTAIRQWAGLSAEDKTRSHIQTNKPEKGNWVQQLRDLFSTGNGIDYRTPEWSKIKRAFVSELDPIKVAIEEAGRRGARVPTRPSENPYILMRQFAYIGRKVDGILRNGMIDINGNTVRPFYRRGGFKSILEPLDNSNPEAFRRDLSGFEAYITSEAIVERHQKLVDSKIETMMSQMEAQLLANGTIKTRGEFKRWLTGAHGWTNEGVDWLVDAKKEATRQAYLEMQDSTGVSKLTGNDVKEAEKTIAEIKADRERERRYRIAGRRYRAWAKSIVEYAVQGGRYTPEEGRAILNLDSYAALHRVMEEPGFGGISKGLSRGKNPIKEWTGSSREIESPVQNLLKQTAALIAETDRNRALGRLVDLFDGQRSTADVSAIAVQAEPGAAGGIKIWRRGQEETWVFEKGIQESLESVGKLQGNLPLAIKWATIPAQVLRTGVTMFPAFAVRNKLRDVQSATMISRNGLGLWDIVKETSTVKWLRAKGGIKNRTAAVRSDIESDKRLYSLYGGGIANEQYLNNAGDWYAARDKMADEITKSGGIVVTAGKPATWYKQVLENVESSTRIAEMKKAIEAVDRLMDTTGWTQEDYAIHGAQSARDLIDFAEGGYVIKAVNRFVPFTNAAVQGVRASTKAARRDPKQFAGRVAWRSIVGAASVYAWNKSMGQEAMDDYDDLPRYRKDFFMPLWVGPNKFIFIPKPFDLGMPQSALTRGLMAVDRGEQVDFGELGTSTSDSVIPIKGDAVMGGPFRPLTEAVTNHDFFRDQSIVPSWEVNKARPERDMSKASRLGQGLSEVLFKGGQDADARTVDAVIRGTFGNMGTYAMTLSDLGRTEKERSAFRQMGDITGVLAESSPVSSKTAQQVMNLGPRVGAVGNPLGAVYDRFKEAKTDDQVRSAKAEFRKALRVITRALGPLANKDPNRMTEIERDKVRAILSQSPYKREKKAKR